MAACVKKLQGLQPLTRRYMPILDAMAQDPVTLGQAQPAAATRHCHARPARRCAPFLQALSRVKKFGWCVKKFGCVCQEIDTLWVLSRE